MYLLFHLNHQHRKKSVNGNHKFTSSKNTILFLKLCIFNLKLTIGVYALINNVVLWISFLFNIEIQSYDNKRSSFKIPQSMFGEPFASIAFIGVSDVFWESYKKETMLLLRTTLEVSVTVIFVLRIWIYKEEFNREVCKISS